MTFLIANHKGALVPFFLAAAVVITSCRSGPQEDMAEVRASETAPAQRRFEFFFKSIREFYRGAGSTSALSEKMVEQDFR